MDSNLADAVVDLKGQVAAVTGGGRGLGRAFATALSTAGAAVAVIARTPSQLEETVAQIVSQGGQAVAFPANVTDHTRLKQVITEIKDRLGPIDILVNNAAIGATYGPLWHLDPADWWRSMEVNLLGPVICARLVLPDMIARQRGYIINVASTSGLGVIANYSTYTVSKTALIRLSENLALEAREHGIQVFAISPPTVRTTLTEAALTEEGRTWIPWAKRYFDQGLFEQPDKGIELLMKLVSGNYGALSGLFLDVGDDLDVLLERIEEIRKERLYTLRLRRVDWLH